MKISNLTVFIGLFIVGLSTSFIAAPFVMNTVFGFFHDPKPQKPEFTLTNPDIQAGFDNLYNKYPDITQDDVNQEHNRLAIACTAWDADPTKTDSSEEGLGQVFRLGFCKGFASGTMNNFLDALGIEYYELEDSGIPPQLIK